MAKRRVLLVFDFDHTIIDENSDTWILSEVHRELYDAMLIESRKSDVQWTELMDSLVQRALQEHSETIHSLKEKFKAIRIATELVEFLKRCREAPEKDIDVYVAILSDANDWYIRWILEHNDLLACFDEIITNPIESDSTPNSMRIRPLNKQPHNCAHRCPTNLCKGIALKHIFTGEKFNLASACTTTIDPLPCVYDRVVYIGDGSNDYCPSTLLRSTDTVLPREGYRLAQKIAANRESIKAERVMLWKDYAELATHLQSVVFD